MSGEGCSNNVQVLENSDALLSYRFLARKQSETWKFNAGEAVYFILCANLHDCLRKSSIDCGCYYNA